MLLRKPKRILEEAPNGIPREMESTIFRKLSHLKEKTTLYMIKTELNDTQTDRTAHTRLQSCLRQGLSPAARLNCSVSQKNHSIRIRILAALEAHLSELAEYNPVHTPVCPIKFRPNSSLLRGFYAAQAGSACAQKQRIAWRAAWVGSGYEGSSSLWAYPRFRTLPRAFRGKARRCK